MNLSPAQKAEFFNRVWNWVRQVPPGKVVTYGQVAEHVGAPAGVPPQIFGAYGSRWVGGAMKGCPDDVPWQRVINSQGRISLQGEIGARQRVLLEAEGVEFDARERVDLRVYGWISADPGAQLNLPGL
jgi:methylated-DNA-protein-cysteine methyltransferase-like protein